MRVAVLVDEGVQDFSRRWSLAYLRNHVKGRACDSDLIEIRWDGSIHEPVLYRCPKYLLSAHTMVPFLPWPDYTEGSSVDLTAVLYSPKKGLEPSE